MPTRAIVITRKLRTSEAKAEELVEKNTGNAWEGSRNTAWGSQNMVPDRMLNWHHLNSELRWRRWRTLRVLDKATFMQKDGDVVHLH